jgi:hypothetical protein
LNISEIPQSEAAAFNHKQKAIMLRKGKRKKELTGILGGIAGWLPQSCMVLKVLVDLRL